MAPTVDPEAIFWGVLGFMWIEFIWEGYIGRRQRKIYKVGISLSYLWILSIFYFIII